MTAGAAIEIAGGLVGKQHARAVHERARNRHALLLAAGKLRGVVFASRAESDRLQRFARSFTGGGIALQLQRQHHVLFGGKRGQQMKRLEHEADQAAPQIRARFFVELFQRMAIELDAAAVWAYPARPAGRAGWSCPSRMRRRWRSSRPCSPAWSTSLRISSRPSGPFTDLLTSRTSSRPDENHHSCVVSFVCLFCFAVSVRCRRPRTAENGAGAGRFVVRRAQHSRRSRLGASAGSTSKRHGAGLDSHQCQHQRRNLAERPQPPAGLAGSISPAGRGDRAGRQRRPAGPAAGQSCATNLGTP